MTQPIHPQTKMGRVALTVGSLDRSLDYYTTAIGLKQHHREGDTITLGSDNEALLVLTENRNGRPTHNNTGLYHFALLASAVPAHSVRDDIQPQYVVDQKGVFVRQAPAPDI